MGRGKQLNLTEEHQEQIRSMRKEGKTYAEIKEFFSNGYNIKLNDPLIAKLCKSGARGPYKKRGSKRGRPRMPVATHPSQDEEEDKKEAVALIHRAFAAHKKDFLKIVVAETQEEK